MVRQFYDGYGEHFKYADGRDFRSDKKRDKDDDICEKHIKDHDNCERLPEKKEDCRPIEKRCEDKGILSSFGLDDIILIGVLIFLLNDGVDDYIIILVIGAIFLLGIMDKRDDFGII